MATYQRVEFKSGAFFDAGLYLLVNAPERGNYGIALDEKRDAIVHVMSPHAGGEVRGYYLVDDKLRLRTPCSPAEWPELDDATATALGIASARRGEQLPLIPGATR